MLSKLTAPNSICGTHFSINQIQSLVCSCSLLKRWHTQLPGESPFEISYLTMVNCCQITHQNTHHVTCHTVTSLQVGPALAVAEIGGVSLPIALGLWIMMLPVLTKVRYELLGVLLKDVKVAKQFAVSAGLNWILGPALMTGLAWACLPDLPG